MNERVHDSHEKVVALFNDVELAGGSLEHVDDAQLSESLNVSVRTVQAARHEYETLKARDDGSTFLPQRCRTNCSCGLH